MERVSREKPWKEAKETRKAEIYPGSQEDVEGNGTRGSVDRKVQWYLKVR